MRIHGDGRATTLMGMKNKQRMAGKARHPLLNDKPAREACRRLFLGHIKIHKNEVTDTASHDKKVKDFMRTKKFVFFIEDGEL